MAKPSKSPPAPAPLLDIPARPWRISLLATGAVGGLIASLVDLSKDDANGAIARMSGMLAKQGLVLDWMRPNHHGILFLILLGIFLCVVYEVPSKAEAFIRGLTALAAVGLIAPQANIGQNRGSEPPAIAADRDAGDVTPGRELFLDVLKKPGVQSGLQLPGALPVFLATSAQAQPAVKIAAVTETGEIIVFLRHVAASPFPPNSRVQVWSRSDRRLVDLFEIKKARFSVVQPRGLYDVEVATDGFETIRFEIGIDEALDGFSATAEPGGNLRSLKQIVIAPRNVNDPVPEASKAKAHGIGWFRVREFDKAAAEYARAAEFDPTDFEAQSFRGYALFRAGNLQLAGQTLDAAQKQFPENAWIALNRLKVLCASGAANAANELTRQEPLRANIDFLLSDGEIRKTCSK